MLTCTEGGDKNANLFEINIHRQISREGGAEKQISPGQILIGSSEGAGDGENRISSG